MAIKWYNVIGMLWTVASLVACTFYHALYKCKYCRNQKPPGLVMAPYMFGVALMSHYALHKFSPSMSFVPSILFQTLMSMNIANWASLIWIKVDKIILKELAKQTISEEMILQYWWMLIFSFGVLVLLFSIVSTTCGREHVIFDDGIYVKPWYFYWHRMVNASKRVDFQPSVTIIES